MGITLPRLLQAEVFGCTINGAGNCPQTATQGAHDEDPYFEAEHFADQDGCEREQAGHHGGQARGPRCRQEDRPGNSRRPRCAVDPGLDQPLTAPKKVPGGPQDLWATLKQFTSILNCRSIT